MHYPIIQACLSFAAIGCYPLSHGWGLNDCSVFTVLRLILLQGLRRCTRPAWPAYWRSSPRPTASVFRWRMTLKTLYAIPRFLSCRPTTRVHHCQWLLLSRLVFGAKFGSCRVSPLQAVVHRVFLFAATSLARHHAWSSKEHWNIMVNTPMISYETSLGILVTPRL